MPLAGADPVFVQAVEEEREQMFPMKLVVAANHLRSRGYDWHIPSLCAALPRNRGHQATQEVVVSKRRPNFGFAK